MGQRWDEGRDADVVNKAVIETMLVRETLFALGDPDLIGLADALLLRLGRANRRYAPAARCLAAAPDCPAIPRGPRLPACATSTA